MSTLEKPILNNVSLIKQNFPAAGPPLNRLTTNVTTTYSAANPYKQTDTSGVHGLVLTPKGVSDLVNTPGAGLKVCFDAPNDATATSWLADATTDSDVLQWFFIPADTTREFIFSSAITRWDMVAVTNTMTVYQEKTR